MSGSPSGKLSRYLPWVLGVVAILGLLLGRVVWSSQQELEIGRTASTDGDDVTAVLHLGRAAHWYTPGNPYVSEALDELHRIGRQAEMEGHVELALSAYRTIRSSCLGTRSFYTPNSDRLTTANRRIASLMAHQDPPPMDRGKTVDQRRDEHFALLENVEQPHPFWSILACLAFFGWVGGSFAFILRGLDKDLGIRRRPALLWGSVVGVGLILWVVSLLVA